MKKRCIRNLVVFCTVAVSLFLSGSVMAEDLNLVILAKGVHPWYDPAGDGFKAAAAEIGGIKTRYTAPTEWSGEAQAKMMEDLIAEGVDGIAVAVYDVGALTPTINEAMERGIPVVSFDAGAEDSEQIMFIGTDNPAAGRQQGEAFIEQTGGKANYVVFVQDLVSRNVKERVEGNREAFKAHPEMKELMGEQSFNYDMSIALQLAENLVNSYGDELQGVIDMGVEGGAAMYRTLKERNVPPGQVKIIGWTTLPDIVEGIEEGYITGSMRQNPYAMGYLSCYALKWYLEGKRPSSKTWDSGIVLTTKENLDTVDTINVEKTPAMLEEFKKIWE